MVEADQGYAGELDFIQGRDNYSSRKARRKKGHIQNQYESGNGWFKCWSILKQECVYNNAKHGLIFHAIDGMPQLGVDNGGCFFDY